MSSRLLKIDRDVSLKLSSFSFLALNGRPAIKDRKNKLVPNNTIYYIKPGEHIFFNCEGITGKPRIPILWTESKGTTQRVMKESDGVVAGLNITFLLFEFTRYWHLYDSL